MPEDLKQGYERERKLEYKGGKSEPSHHHCERISSGRRRGVLSI